MKYLEELTHGETFKVNDTYWFLTQDFKAKGQKLCYNLQNGHAKWFEGNLVVDISPIYTLDKDNNIIPIKEYKNENSNIS